MVGEAAISSLYVGASIWWRRFCLHPLIQNFLANFFVVELKSWRYCWCARSGDAFRGWHRWCPWWYSRAWIISKSKTATNSTTQMHWNHTDFNYRLLCDSLPLAFVFLNWWHCRMSLVSPSATTWYYCGWSVIVHLAMVHGRRDFEICPGWDGWVSRYVDVGWCAPPRSFLVRRVIESFSEGSPTFSPVSALCVVVLLVVRRCCNWSRHLLTATTGQDTWRSFRQQGWSEDIIRESKINEGDRSS